MPCLVASIIAMYWCHILHPSLFNQFHGPSTITKEEQRVPMFPSLDAKVVFKALNLSSFSTIIDLVVKSSLQSDTIIRYTGCFLMNGQKYELTVSARRLLSTWDRCQKFDILGTFWYLAFKITKKSFFVKIELCGKNFLFSNISENTKENFINFPDWFYFSSLF